MSRISKMLAATLGLLVSTNLLAPLCASAQSSSSEVTVETRGVGFKNANVFNPKYKERIGTYEEQIQMGITKGWLTAAEAEQFKTRLEGMKKQEADFAAKGWVKADVDVIDKVFTQFNMDLHKASNKPAASAASSSSSSSTTTAKPADTVAGGETKTATKAVTKKKTVKSTKAPAKKPAAAKTTTK